MNYVFGPDGKTEVMDSYFMGYHKTLRNSKDFYEAYRFVKELSESLTEKLRIQTGNDQIEIFPYRYIISIDDTLI